MRNRAAQQTENTAKDPVLYMAFELGDKSWRLRFGDGSRTRDIQMPARDLRRLVDETAKTKRKFRLPDRVRVLSCYEAGRDGFWLHRYLKKHGIENLVVDSASIEVNRRRRRAKTDRLDAAKLLSMLIRHDHGEKPWSVVRVPDAESEDWRRIHREIERLKKETRQHRVRIQSLLVSQGIVSKVRRNFREWLETRRLWDGSELGSYLKQELIREYERLELCQGQIQELEALRRKLVDEQCTEALAKIAMLLEVRGIGMNGAWVLGMEWFGWRTFRNRREVGSLAGLDPTPYESGEGTREQGISKAGHGRVRWLMVELAWGWLRYQPQSELSQWYYKEFGRGGKRMRRIGIVAMARKLLIALWRYVEAGVIPEGAMLKAAE